jgi:hypothetical protein
LGRVIDWVIREGRVQTRQVPSGPVMVPSFVRPGTFGQSAAGVTVAGVGVGAGAGGGLLLLIVTSPPRPSAARSSGPQPVSTRALHPASSMP